MKTLAELHEAIEAMMLQCYGDQLQEWLHSCMYGGEEDYKDAVVKCNKDLRDIAGGILPALEGQHFLEALCMHPSDKQRALTLEQAHEWFGLWGRLVTAMSNPHAACEVGDFFAEHCRVGEDFDENIKSHGHQKNAQTLAHATATAVTKLNDAANGFEGKKAKILLLSSELAAECIEKCKKNIIGAFETMYDESKAQAAAVSLVQSDSWKELVAGVPADSPGMPFLPRAGEAAEATYKSALVKVASFKHDEFQTSIWCRSTQLAASQNLREKPLSVSALQKHGLQLATCEFLCLPFNWWTQTRRQRRVSSSFGKHL